MFPPHFAPSPVLGVILLIGAKLMEIEARGDACDASGSGAPCFRLFWIVTSFLFGNRGDKVNDWRVEGRGSGK